MLSPTMYSLDNQDCTPFDNYRNPRRNAHSPILVVAECTEGEHDGSKATISISISRYDNLITIQQDHCIV